MATRDAQGRFVQGQRYSPETEFKKGEHWRPPQPYWNRDWLLREYVDKQRTAAEIAADMGCGENNILYFFHKFGIGTRTMSETRRTRQWALVGEANPMFGKIGAANPNWKGGVTEDRQAFYSSQVWKAAVAAVWRRDCATCQRCGKVSKRKGKSGFHIHHKESFEVEELRADLCNLVLLCRGCHRWVHSRANTDGEFLGREVSNSGATGTI